jgi:signal transduction histidine kinase
MHRAIETWLGPICRVLEIDALTLFSTAHGPDELRPLYSWQSHGDIAQHHLDLARRSLVENVPASPSRVMPLISEEQTLGAIAFECQRDGLGPDLMSNMRLVAEALAGSLGRKRSEDALRASEVMKSAILHSLTSGVAVIDRDGRLLEVNDRWMRLATDCEWMHLPAGGSVIATWRRMYAGGNQLAGLIADGVTAVLDGSRAQFNIEHSTDSGGGVQWWSISAVPLNRTGGGAVITRSDITELRRAEMEAQRSRHELAHVSRVSTIGELTASIAHQLNQPLTAILTNTQVARRLIEAVPVSVEGRLPAVAELRAILHDIESDDRRASDVIARLRTLLRKGGLELTWFNLTAAIQDVVALVGSDAIIREVAISTDFATTPVMMRGDRVQLQQVILNLLQNAMDAMSDQRQRPRAVVIACRHEADDRRVRVTVSDSGPGIEEGLDQTIFEPFYSTKPGGMGIGLSIVRSIIEAHGGSIRAIGGSRGGAVFEFVLPDDGRPPDER